VVVTVKYIHTVFHRCLSQALKWGLVTGNVADSVDAPTPDKKPVEPLTQPQVRHFLEVAEQDRLYPFYVVALGCGLRKGELLALTWDCIDWHNRLIHVKRSLQALKGKGLVVGEPKSQSSRRVVAMPEFVQRVLADHMVNKTVESEYVFCTSKGTPFGPRNIIRHFKGVLKKAGLPATIRIHDLRHTFISFMFPQKMSNQLLVILASPPP
jgi:integrase